MQWFLKTFMFEYVLNKTYLALSLIFADCSIVTKTIWCRADSPVISRKSQEVQRRKRRCSGRHSLIVAMIWQAMNQQNKPFH